MRALLALVVLVGCVPVAAAVHASRPPELRRYDTPYYVIHTDLPDEGAAEAVARMTPLATELRTRTRALGFTGRITERLPFYLYARRADYLATGAPGATAGAFLGDRLVAAAFDDRRSTTWHVVQHEAFHQFAAATSGPELPAWLNEGLGEYFGEALFTGDGYVTGVVPAWRLARVKQSVKIGRFPPLAGFARLSQDDWNRNLNLAHYDQAWSMVQFLLHADNERHRERLVRFIGALAKDGAQDAAALDWDALADDWKRYWLDMPDEGTGDLELEAAVATVTSFYARAVLSKQTFDTFDDFVKAAHAGRLRAPRDQWLPPSLLLRTLDALPAGVKWAITREGRTVAIGAAAPDGAGMIGWYVVRDGRVSEVTVVRPR